jgi:acyl-coenzyme A synthetase/AMP-(fatty) acid ligase
MSEHEELFARRPYNAAADFVDSNVARGHAGKVAFKEKDRALTYGELQAASCRFGRGLYKLGLRPESRIVLLHLDTIGIAGRLVQKKVQFMNLKGTGPTFVDR